MDCPKRTQQRRTRNRTKHVNQWVFCLVLGVLDKLRCHSGACCIMVSRERFPGRWPGTTQVNVLQEPGFSWLFTHSSYNGQWFLQNNSKKKKKGVSSKYSHFLTYAGINKASLSQSSNWEQCHIMLTCHLKLQQKTNPSPQSH